MPSPPRAGQLLPPGDAGRLGWPASVDVDDAVRASAQQQRRRPRRHEPVAASSMCQRWSRSTMDARPRVASRWNGASRRSSSDGDRPAVAPVGVDVALDVLARALRALERASPTSTPRAARLLERARPPRASAGAGGGADRGVLAAEQLLRLGRPGHQLAVEAAPSRCRARSQRPARVERPRARARAAPPRVARVVEEPPAGAGVARSPDSPSSTRRSARAPPSSSRQTTTTAREPMCFSSQTTAATPCVAEVGERLGRVLEQARPLRRLATATSSAAGRSATAGRRRSGSSPPAPRSRSPRGS